MRRVNGSNFVIELSQERYLNVPANGKPPKIKNIRELKLTLIHENQHMIQHVEGFAFGGLNLNLAGEVEARNVSRREYMRPEQRLNTPLSATEDIARELQDVKFEDRVLGASATPDQIQEVYKQSQELEKQYLKAISESISKGNKAVTDNLRQALSRQRKRTKQIRAVAQEAQSKIYESDTQATGGDAGFYHTLGETADEKQLARQLEQEVKRGEYVTMYRAVVEIDGKYYSPMATKKNAKTLTSPIALGKWEVADELPVDAEGNLVGAFIDAPNNTCSFL